MFYSLQIGDNNYKLKLSTEGVIRLEKAIGCNPMMIFGSAGDRVPMITEMVHILWASLQSYHHGISLNDAMAIFDSWINEGHSPDDFIAIIIDIYKASGIIKDNKKNSEAEEA